MQLKKLFDAQKELSNRIMEEHPELKGQDNLPWKILAFQVEVSELANEWRGFKMWSHDRKQRTEKKINCFSCMGTGDENFEFVQEAAEGSGGHKYVECEECNGTGVEKVVNPLLEEYVDCLHFLLDIGLELEFDDRANSLIKEFIYTSDYPLLDLFMEVNMLTSELYWTFRFYDYEHETIENQYKEIFEHFIILGRFLGFTWEEIEAAYFEKNKINHDRQDQGY